MEKGPRYSYTQAAPYRKDNTIGFQQYHEPASELPHETRQNILFRSGDIVEGAQCGEDVEDKTK